MLISLQSFFFFCCLHAMPCANYWPITLALLISLYGSIAVFQLFSHTSFPLLFLSLPLLLVLASSSISFNPNLRLLPICSSRRVHFERINTVPIKGHRAGRRSFRRHHQSLSRTLIRYTHQPQTREWRGYLNMIQQRKAQLQCICA